MTSASAASLSSSGAVTPKEQPASRWTSTEVPVKVIAGCRASGGRRPQRGVEHLGPVPPGGVDEQLPGSHGAGLGEAFDQAWQRVVGDGQQHELGAREDLGGGDQGDVGEQGCGPAHGCVGDTGHGDRAVPGELQRGGEGGADPARTDDSDGEAGRAVPRVEGFSGN